MSSGETVLPREKYGKPIRRKVFEEELQPGYNAHIKPLSRYLDKIYS